MFAAIFPYLEAVRGRTFVRFTGSSLKVYPNGDANTPTYLRGSYFSFSRPTQHFEKEVQRGRRIILAQALKSNLIYPAVPSTNSEQPAADDVGPSRGTAFHGQQVLTEGSKASSAGTPTSRIDRYKWRCRAPPEPTQHHDLPTRRDSLRSAKTLIF